jgi:hypothetical protein
MGNSKLISSTSIYLSIWEITCEKGAGKSIGSTTHRHSIPFMMDMNICAQLFLRFAGKDGHEMKWTECSPLILGK